MPKLESLESPQVEATSPDFTLKDIGGGEARLRDLVLLGPLVLIFCRACERCVEHLREFKMRNVALKEAGATIVIVVEGKAAQTRAFVEKERLPFRVLADEKGDALTTWGIGESIATFIVDKAGVVRFRATDDNPAGRVLDWLRGHGAGQAQS